MRKLFMALITEEPGGVREGAGGSVNLTVGRDEVCSGQLLLGVVPRKLLIYLAERCAQRGRSGVNYLIRIGIGINEAVKLKTVGADVINLYAVLAAALRLLM